MNHCARFLLLSGKDEETIVANRGRWRPLLFRSSLSKGSSFFQGLRDDFINQKISYLPICDSHKESSSAEGVRVAIGPRKEAPLPPLHR